MTDGTTTGKAHRSAVEKISPNFFQNLGFTYISLADMTMDELAGNLSKLEKNSIVLLLQHFKDKNGTSYTVQYSTPLLTKSSSVPVFVLTDIRIGLGALGGHVVSGYHHGEAAAQMVAKILKGADVKSIPVLLDSPNKYMFDYRVMERFHIPAKALPPESIIINRPDTVLDLYKKYLVLVTLSIVALVGIIVWMWREFKSRKKTEELLRESNETLSLFVHNSPIYTYIKVVTPTESRVLQASENFLEMVGIPGSQMVGKTMAELFPAEFAAKITENDWAVVSSGVVMKVDETFNGRNYTTVKSPLIKGEKTLLAGFTMDITERKRAEEELRASTEDLKDSQRIAHVGSWRMDLASNEVFWSEELYKMYGFDPKLPPPPYTEHQKLFTTESWEKLSSALQNSQFNGIPYDLELETVRDDGSFGWMWVYGKPVLDAKGVIVGLRGMAQDITEFKMKENALRDSETQYRMLVNNLSAGVVVHVTDSSIIFANQMASTLLGLSRDQLMGKTAIDPAWCFLLENGTPMDLEEYPVNQVLKSGKPLSGFTIGICRPDLSDPLWVLCNAYPIESSEGLLQQVVVVFSDITKLKKAEDDKLIFEQQIQHTQKLESLGVLSGGIAHDFNNILAIIMGYCSLTKMDYETAEHNIQEIEKAAERAAALCRQMLAYAGKAQLAMSQLNMCTLLDEMVTMLKATLPQNAEINLDLPTDIPFINGDASQIRQIVMNLIINASEAIGKEHGEIQVSLATIAIKTGQSEEEYNGKSIPSGWYVCLKVTDNGCGMDEETKWRIFEPFYTTKFTGRGLGMSAVLGIINSHGGSLQLQSHLGQGTTFKVYLPVPKTNSTESDDQKHIPSAPWKGSGTILLVEDEDQVRQIAKALLKNFGFAVLEAVNGKDALELYQTNATDITLVLTDMGMPIMDGYELFSELKKLNPELPIIISSGYGDAEVGSRIGIDNIDGLISKPYGPDQLREVLKGVIEGTL